MPRQPFPHAAMPAARASRRTSSASSRAPWSHLARSRGDSPGESPSLPRKSVPEAVGASLPASNCPRRCSTVPPEGGSVAVSNVRRVARAKSRASARGRHHAPLRRLRLVGDREARRDPARVRRARAPVPGPAEGDARDGTEAASVSRRAFSIETTQRQNDWDSGLRRPRQAGGHHPAKPKGQRFPLRTASSRRGAARPGGEGEPT
jgi:hypothetical protein